MWEAEAISRCAANTERQREGRHLHIATAETWIAQVDSDQESTLELRDLAAASHREKPPRVHIVRQLRQPGGCGGPWACPGAER